MEIVLGYLWPITLNVIYIVVVVYVFERLQGQTELSILVAILGLIYVSLRMQGFTRDFQITAMAEGLDREFTRLRELLNENANRLSERKVALTASERKADFQRGKRFIEIVSSALIGLICVLVLFSNLR